MTDQHAVEQMPVTVREWTDILARIRFGKVKAAGRSLTGATIKLVAGRLASYADGNGTRIRPGLARVAVDLELDYRTARLAVAHLRSVGLLGLVRAGGRRGADEYRLTLPVDLLERDDLTVWSPTEHRAEVERLADARRRLPRDPGGGPDDGGSRGPQGPVKDGESQGHQGPVKATSGAPITGPSGTPKSAITGPSGPQSLGPQGPATHQDLDTTTTHHPDQDLRTAVTLPGETGPTTNPESPLRPKKCPDGLSPAIRPDGLPECPICRRRATRPGIYRPPPPGDRIAPVIDLRTREVS